MSKKEFLEGRRASEPDVAVFYSWANEVTQLGHDEETLNDYEEWTRRCHEAIALRKRRIEELRRYLEENNPALLEYEAG